MLNLYVTSTKQGEGKTFLTAGLAATMQSLGYKCCVYKPIQTNCVINNGFFQSQDIMYVKAADPYIKTHFTYLYDTNLEPLIASEQENESIDVDLINGEYTRLSAVSDCTILDGDRGLMSPISTNCQNLDMVNVLQTPLLLVVTPRTDAINDVLQTIYVAKDRGISIRGVVINNILAGCSKSLLNSMPRIIEEYTGVQILGLISHINGKFRPSDLITSILNGVDVESILNVKIEKLKI